MRARAETGARGRSGGPIPALQVLGTAGPAEVAGGCSRRPERCGWHASRWGKPLTPDGLWRRWPLAQVTKDLCRTGHRGLGGAWSGAGVLVT